jgi:hypothetical protein
MPRASTAYSAKVGPYAADSDARKGNRQMLSLLVERGMDGPGRCVVELADPLFAPVAAGERMTIELDAGAGGHTVFTGETYASETTATGQVVRAADALAKLAAVRVSGAFEGVTTDTIAKDIIGQAGATAGEVAPGPDLAAYVLHPQPRALHHLSVLAALAGADVWTDGAGKVQVGAPKTGGADHRFKLGETILALDLRLAPPAVDGIAFSGEGAAGSDGAEAAHWLTTDLAGVSAKAAVDAQGQAQKGQAGTHPRPAADGALRAGAAVGDAAEAWAKAAAWRWIRGRLEVTGAPEVEPGDLVTLDGLPADNAAAKLLEGGRCLRVRAVRHVLDRARGLRTRLEF